VRLTTLDRRNASGVILERKQEVGEPAYRLTLAVALLKNQKRFDFMVEKASELGVSRIVPLVTARTEKRSLRDQRVENVLVAAMKQCGRSRLVEIASVADWAAWVRHDASAVRILCHEKTGDVDNLLTHLQPISGRPSLEIAIGPEGGFSEAEVEAARSAGYRLASLGPRRLRAETAAMAACAGVMMRYGGKTAIGVQNAD
jgi:16S rRNA (uracil1498-N3)-methyltransferase